MISTQVAPPPADNAVKNARALLGTSAAAEAAKKHFSADDVLPEEFKELMAKTGGKIGVPTAGPKAVAAWFRTEGAKRRGLSTSAPSTARDNERFLDARRGTAPRRRQTPGDPRGHGSDRG